jgi:hypothetical protein
MKTDLSTIDRRRFLRGTGIALALPWFESFTKFASAAERKNLENRKRLACFYIPDGVPMPLAEDPAYQDWSWFPHGHGKNFTLTKCLEPLDPLRDDLTVLAGFSHPAVRNVHGHSNADQFLTGADTGGRGDYKNSISLDQVFAAQAGEHTRVSSLVMSTDGGTGSPRGAQTMSYNHSGRAIPAEHKPKRIFDLLFAKSDADAARKLALSQSALDEKTPVRPRSENLGSISPGGARYGNQSRESQTLDEYPVCHGERGSPPARRDAGGSAELSADDV